MIEHTLVPNHEINIKNHFSRLFICHCNDMYFKCIKTGMLNKRYAE